LVRGVSAVERFYRDVVAGRIGDGLASEINQPGLSGGWYGDDGAAAILAEVFATESGAGAQTLAEKGSERGEIG